jgi:histone acetyltransferase 1
MGLTSVLFASSASLAYLCRLVFQCYSSMMTSKTRLFIYMSCTQSNCGSSKRDNNIFTCANECSFEMEEKRYTSDDDDDGPSSAALCIQFHIPVVGDADAKDGSDGSGSGGSDASDASGGTAHQEEPILSPSTSLFHPVYTHQIFPQEYIPGYQPYLNLDGSNMSQIEEEQPPQRHASFQYPTTHELLIRVHLVPSCATCSVSILLQQQYTEKKRKEPLYLSCCCRSNGDKKQKLEDGRNDDSTATTIDELRMSLDNITERIQKYLPPITDIRIHDIRIRDNFMLGHSTPNFTPPISHPHRDDLSQPIGTVIKEYERHNTKFCISICDGMDCEQYHHAIQKLAVYFIENADDVNINHSSWKVLYIFQQNDDHCHAPNSYTYSLVGYTTLYYFANPFRKPTPGTIVRICQALILPPYQRRGHGKIMLHTVYDHLFTPPPQQQLDELPPAHPAEVDDTNIVELNVEDPAPAFAYLRLMVDYERYKNSPVDWFGSLGKKKYDVRHPLFFTPLSDGDARAVTIVAQTTSRQIQMVYEMDRLQQLLYYQQHGEQQQQVDEKEENDDSDDDHHAFNLPRVGKSIHGTVKCILFQRFSSMVEQRLKRQHREELVSACYRDDGDNGDGSKERMEQELERMYDHVDQQYRRIVEQYL